MLGTRVYKKVSSRANVIVTQYRLFCVKNVNVLFLNEIKFLFMILLVTVLVVDLMWFIHDQ